MKMNALKNITATALLSLPLFVPGTLMAADGVKQLITISGTGGTATVGAPFENDVKISTVIVKINQLETKFCSLSFRVLRGDGTGPNEERILLFDWKIRDDDKKEALTEKIKQFDFGEGITLKANIDWLSFTADSCGASVYWYWKDITE